MKDLVFFLSLYIFPVYCFIWFCFILFFEKNKTIFTFAYDYDIMMLHFETTICPIKIYGIKR